MAILNMSYFSNELMRTVPVTVVLPSDKRGPDGSLISKPPYKTLYLLHGIFGDNTDWLYGTRAAHWAMDHDLALVMPSGENNFYLDHSGGGANYSKWIGKELVEMTRAMFPLSHRREDTAIGGLSMGGFGALVNGLAYPDTFGKIAGLSAAMPADQEPALKDEKEAVNLLESRAYMEACFGGKLESLKGTMADHHHLARKTVLNAKELPEIFMASGVDDPLFVLDKNFAHELEHLGYDVIWKEGPGGHDWDFWDRMIEDVISWVAPEPGAAGVSSGNVHS